VIALHEFHFGGLRIWARRLSVITALLVALLSWHSGVSAVLLIVRTSVALLVLLGLTLGTVALFEKTAPPLPAEVPEQGKGTLVDVAVGDGAERENPLLEGVQGLSTAGLDLSPTGLTPGQVRKGLAAGLPDAVEQAEIVRRMGWGLDPKESSLP